MYSNTVIPPITDPLGKNWDQPALSELFFCNIRVHMSWATFDKLMEYSISKPSGAYAGKMWKANEIESVDKSGHIKLRNVWYLCWYVPCPKEPEKYLITKTVPIRVYD